MPAKKTAARTAPTPKKTDTREVEVEEAQVPTPKSGAPEVAPDLEESQATSPSSLGFVQPREIEVEALPDRPRRIESDGMVEVRMARTIEEFTYGNPHVHYELEAGKRYRLPVYVAQYLDGLEALHHRV